MGMVNNNSDITDVKLRYIKSEPYGWFTPGEIYIGSRAKDDVNKVFWFIYLDETQNEDPGYCGFPSSWFEIVED